MRRWLLYWRFVEHLFDTDDIYFVLKENRVQMDFSMRGMREYLAGRAVIRVSERQIDG